MRKLFATACMATLPACAVGPNYVRPAIDAPAAFKSAAAPSASAPLRADWWRVYEDAELDRLITTATAANQTIQQAIAAVDQARALTRVAASFRYPTVTLNPAATRQRTSASRNSPITGQAVGTAAVFNDFMVPADFRYEVDVWGRVRRSIEAQRAIAAATQDDEAVVELAVQTDVAQAYYTLRGLDAQAEILAETVASYREQVRILTVQVNTGLTSPIPLNQAQALLQSTLAQQTDVARARANEEHALAILCGQAAPTFALAAKPLRDVSTPPIPAEVPAAVLRQRPDVAEAEHRLAAANAQVGVATASLYPTIGVSGSAGFEAVRISSLLDWQSRLWSIVGGLTAPIFEGGRLRANLDAARAQYRGVVAAYINQVLTVYTDVEDSLTDLGALRAEVVSLRGATSASEEYLRVAHVQFRSGLVDYLTVIDAERTLLTNQISLAQALTGQMTASVRLVKALGGGWQPA